MRNHKLHLAWGAVALAFAALVGFVVAQRKESSFKQRENRLRKDLARLEQKVHESGHTTTPLAPLPSPTASRQPSDEGKEPSATAVGQAGGGSERSNRDRRGNEKLTKDQILALLSKKNRDRGDLWRALRALSELTDPAEKREVLMALLGVDDGRVQYRAFSMLLEMGGPEALALAADMLKAGDNSWLKARAADYLGSVGGPTALAALQDAYLTGDTRLKTAAAVALNQLGQPGPMEQFITEIAPTLQSTDGAYREDTVQILGRLKSSSTLPYLSTMVNDPNSEVRLEVVDALRDTGSTEAIPLLQQMLNDPNPEVISKAKQAIERINNPPQEGDSDRR